LATDSAWLNAQIARLYGPDCQPSLGQKPASLWLHQENPAPSERIRLEDRHSGHVEAAVSVQRALQRLRERVQYCLVADDEDHLMLHGAGIIGTEKAIALPAPSGAGKTTLATWLLGEGFGLLSDELVAVDANGWTQGFRQPLNAKIRGMDLIRSFPWMAERVAASVQLPAGHLLPWAKPLSRGGEHLGALVFPKFTPGSPLTIEPLTTAQATAEVMSCLLNARNLPQLGLRQAATLCRSVPAWRIQYSSLRALGGWLQSQLPTEGRPARDLKGTAS